MFNKTLGILGGGQLGRMSAMAASRLGIDVHIFCPEPDSPASRVTNKVTQADYNDWNALKSFAESVDYVTYEFENIPVETIRYIKNIRPVYPDDYLLEISQDRLKEKQFLNDCGIKTALWQKATSPDDITAALKRWNTPTCILKTTRFGYDGKGQLKHNITDDTLRSLNKLGVQDIIIEQIVDFAYESSVLVARDKYGKISSLPPVVNEHRNHILWKTYADGQFDPGISKKLSDIAHHFATQVRLTGLMAIEFFVTDSGEIYANEIAPRPHNSGHWTMDGCVHSQFDLHVMSVCEMPIPDVFQHSHVTMINILGEDMHTLSGYEKNPCAKIHLYGKRDAKDGRKMGHVNIIDTK